MMHLGAETCVASPKSKIVNDQKLQMQSRFQLFLPENLPAEVKVRRCLAVNSHEPLLQRQRLSFKM